MRAVGTHWRCGRSGLSALGRTGARAGGSGTGPGSFRAGGRGATGGTESPVLAASLGGVSSTVIRNLGLLAGTGGGSGAGGPRGDRWKDLSLSQFRAAAAARPAEPMPGPGRWGSGLGLSGKHGGRRRPGRPGRLPTGGSLILREGAGARGPGSGHLGPSLKSSGAGPASGRPRFGGGGGSRGLGPLEVKEWARGVSAKAGFLGVGTGGGG